MWFNIFCLISVWAGLILLVGACCGLSNALEQEDQEHRGHVQWAGRVGLFFIVLGAVFFFCGPAKAQVVMWPGQELAFCNGIGAISGGGTVCKHNINEDRIELTFMNPMWHATFWGDGTAGSLLPPLCRYSNVNRVTETVFEPGLVRVRTIPCSTGKSGPWVVVEVPK